MKFIDKSLIVILITLSSFLQAQDFTNAINKAWQTNKQLQGKNFELQTAMSAYKESKAMYGPTASFGIQYSLASGGRSIDFPVGDLLNPVYSTLNQLTSTNAFPKIDNVNEQFLPNNFYDSRIRITQPIYYPDLAINKKAKKESISLKELEIKSFKRQITADVMKAYFQCFGAKQAIAILSNADTLLLEAKRSTQSMIKNGVALPSALSRIENQIAGIQSQKLEATSNFYNAVRYYNYLQGNMDNSENFQEINFSELPDLNNQLAQGREEIAQYNQGIKLKSILLEKEKQFYYPKLGLQLDVGSQAFDFGLQPYSLLGINLEISLFDSKRHAYRSEQIKSDIAASENQKSFVEDQISLQVATSKENLQSSIAQANTYKVRVGSTEKIYAETLKKYKEGVTNYLELLDAHTQVVQTNLQYNLAKNNAWMRWADFMYSTASYPIN